MNGKYLQLHPGAVAQHLCQSHESLNPQIVLRYHKILLPSPALSPKNSRADQNTSPCECHALVSRTLSHCCARG